MSVVLGLQSLPHPPSWSPVAAPLSLVHCRSALSAQLQCLLLFTFPRGDLSARLLALTTACHLYQFLSMSYLPSWTVGFLRPGSTYVSCLYLPCLGQG